MKYLFMAFLLLTGIFAKAQNSSKDALKRKTQKELTAVIEASPSVVGLAVMDLTSNETFFVNEQRVFTQASAIKIPILMEVFKQVHAGKMALSDQKQVTVGNRVGGSGILQQMQDPVSISLRDLCTLMITQSDNTATNVVINTIGMENVNKTMQELGFTNTKLQRYMMDTAAAAQGRENLSTPVEAVKILNLLYHGKFINAAMSGQVIAMLKKNARTGSRIAKALPAQVPVAFKPGALISVSTEWAIVYLNKRPYAIAVMENGRVPGDSSETMEKISKIVYEYFASLPTYCP
jgi:beta-lactamase class A